MGTRIVTKFAPGYSERNNPLQSCMGCYDSVVLHLKDGDPVTDPEYSGYIGKYVIRASVINLNSTSGPSADDPYEIVKGVSYQFQYDERFVTRPLTENDICQFSCESCSVRDYLEKSVPNSPYENTDGGSNSGNNDGVMQTRYCFDLSDDCIEFPVEVHQIIGCPGILFNHEEDGQIIGESGQLLADALNCKPETSALGWWQWSEDDKTLCVYSFGKEIKSLTLKSANGKVLCLDPEKTNFSEPLAAYQQAAFTYIKEVLPKALGACLNDDVCSEEDCAYDPEFVEAMRETFQCLKSTDQATDSCDLKTVKYQESDDCCGNKKYCPVVVEDEGYFLREEEAAGGGVCVDINASGIASFQSRDSTVVGGSINVIANPVGYLEAVAVNPWNCPALVIAELGFEPNTDGPASPVQFASRISSSLNISSPVFGSLHGPGDPISSDQLDTLFVRIDTSNNTVAGVPYGGFPWPGSVKASSAGLAKITAQLLPNATKSFYAQWWAWFTERVVLHGGMSISFEYHKLGAKR